MNEVKETYEELDAIYRYKKSILLDSFIGIIFLAPILFLLSDYLSTETVFVKPLSFLVFIIFFMVYFLSDKVFKTASIGKKIYKIKLASQSNDGIVSLKSIIYRRFLEVWIHPMFSKMNFLEKSRFIDKHTETKIVKND
ncbi:MAG TPA: hypothetical protein DDW82_02220 [Acholeplasmataceae bacterium]|nr:hypothetical protein [Acholeplasmataceae bacterium]